MVRRIGHGVDLDLERGVFAKATATDIARSLKRSAERSQRRKATPYRSAMSMLTFYLNRAGKKQTGISFLLCDMKTPGVRAEPFLTLGGTPAFCDTYFDNVKVPKQNLVGPLHGGWALAKALLGHERVGIGDVGGSTRMLRNLKRIAQNTQINGGRLIDDPVFRAKIARLEIRIESLRMVIYKTLAGAERGRFREPL